MWSQHDWSGAVPYFVASFTFASAGASANGVVFSLSNTRPPLSSFYKNDSSHLTSDGRHQVTVVGHTVKQDIACRFPSLARIKSVNSYPES